MKKLVETELAGRRLTIETGELAKQANGSVVIRYADTMVLATAVMASEPKTGIDFFPLTIDYREKTYAAGKIPGGFFKREGRPSEKETLTSRLIDRPIRPLFANGFNHETMVMCSVISADSDNDPDILALIGASAALTVSNIPFLGPVGAARIGMIDNKFILNPTFEEVKKSVLNLTLATTSDGIVMVECGAQELPENILVDALMFGEESIKPVLELQRNLQEEVQKPKMVVVPVEVNEDLAKQVESFCAGKISDAFRLEGKLEINKALTSVLAETVEHFIPSESSEEDLAQKKREVVTFFYATEKKVVRKQIVDENRRPDGRGLRDVRAITCTAGMLPRAHGSGVFTRGETQALVVATLGTAHDEQTIDSLTEKVSKSFMLHYNFPPFCVGEVGFIRGPGRREIGHGALAERAIVPVLPGSEEFPYTIRIVSDILESNGSSSMASVCGASLSLMDAGVPISSPVAGIAMGLIQEGEKFVVLSDIQGTEDHLGDMDFKVAGTKKGITSLQMDIKINGVTKELLERAMEQAQEGRDFILGKMNEVIAQPRSSLSQYAPRILTMKVKSEKVRDVIGPGGKIIRGIIEKTGVDINIDDHGLISISSVDEEAAKQAVEMIENITQEVETGKVYLGTVKKITNFGAFVELFPGTEGLLHISEIANYRVNEVSDELSEGEQIKIKVKDVDRSGKIKLSRKDLLSEENNGGSSGE